MKENSIYIHPVKKYKVIYDSATLSLNNCQISGDNLLIKTINESNFLCALSDGMGSGFYAYQLSQETLKMVDNITNCNISFDAALQILNNFFKTKDLSDSYATLDLVNINLTDGILDLYKLGSSTTYISRGDKIIPIYNNNLPFGISDLVTKEEYGIADNDLIILVSDGINDYIDEGLLVKFIETIKDELPHKIVYEILQKIYYENKNQIKDDMSCIAIKIKSI
jgi:stage II sporulation protein E